MSQEDTNNKKEPYRIVVQEHEPFCATQASNIMTLNNFSDLVAQLFGPAYADFAGCAIQPNGSKFDVKLYFTASPCSEDSVTAFRKNMIYNQNASFYDKVNTLSGMSNPKSVHGNFALTDEGREGLESFLIPDERNGRIRWEYHIFEENLSKQNMLYGQQPESYAFVTKVSIEKLALAIFGDRDDNGNKVFYSIGPIRPLTPGISQYGAPVVTDWLINITRLYESALNELSKATGIVVSNGIPMVRYRR